MAKYTLHLSCVIAHYASVEVEAPNEDDARHIGEALTWTDARVNTALWTQGDNPHSAVQLEDVTED